MARFLFATGVLVVLAAVDWPWRNRSLQILAPFCALSSRLLLRSGCS